MSSTRRQRLADNKSEYAFSTYLADAAAMLARVTAACGRTWLERLRGGPRRDDRLGRNLHGRPDRDVLAASATRRSGAWC